MIKFAVFSWVALAFVTQVFGQAYWYESLAKQGVAPYNPQGSAYKVFRNVKDFGAKGLNSLLILYEFPARMWLIIVIFLQVMESRMILPPSTAPYPMEPDAHQERQVWDVNQAQQHRLMSTSQLGLISSPRHSFCIT